MNINTKMTNKILVNNSHGDWLKTAEQKDVHALPHVRVTKSQLIVS